MAAAKIFRKISEKAEMKESEENEEASKEIMKI